MTAPRIHRTRGTRVPFAPGSPTVTTATVGANPSTNAATAIAAQHREDPR